MYKSRAHDLYEDWLEKIAICFDCWVFLEVFLRRTPEPIYSKCILYQ
jgi:hypothetical protein